MFCCAWMSLVVCVSYYEYHTRALYPYCQYCMLSRCSHDTIVPSNFVRVGHVDQSFRLSICGCLHHCLPAPSPCVRCIFLHTLIVPAVKQILETADETADPASKRARSSQEDTLATFSPSPTSPLLEQPDTVLNGIIPTLSGCASPDSSCLSDGSSSPPVPSVGGGGCPAEAQTIVLTDGRQEEDCQRHVPAPEAQQSIEAPSPSAGKQPAPGVWGAAAVGARDMESSTVRVAKHEM